MKFYATGHHQEIIVRPRPKTTDGKSRGEAPASEHGH